MAYKFCSKCGAELNVIDDAPFAAQTCSVCGTTHYHNSKPSVGALVVENRRLLLVRRAIEPFKNFWDVPGGFLEPGEHPEDGLKREVFEETGLEVRVTSFHGIYMDCYGNDPRPTLNIYYLAEPIGGEEHPASDARELGWFSWDNLPEQIAFAHARGVLDAWRAKELELISI